VASRRLSEPAADLPGRECRDLGMVGPVGQPGERAGKPTVERGTGLVTVWQGGVDNERRAQVRDR
jgi:hypothetical protein